jgi:hypothetical protein
MSPDVLFTSQVNDKAKSKSTDTLENSFLYGFVLLDGELETQLLSEATVLPNGPMNEERCGRKSHNGD